MYEIVLKRRVDLVPANPRRKEYSCNGSDRNPDGSLENDPVAEKLIQERRIRDTSKSPP